MRKAILFGFVLSFLFAAIIGHAVIPEYITLQGRLTDTNSNPLNGLYDFDLEIYDAASGGSLIWSETQSNVNVTNGIFNILLGNVQTLDDAFDDEYWIEISVEDSALSPRVRLTSSPYAYYAENAGTLTDVFVNETGDTMTGRLNIRSSGNVLNISQSIEAFTRAVNISGSTVMRSNGVYDTLNVNQDNSAMYSGSFYGGKGIYLNGNLNLTSGNVYMNNGNIFDANDIYAKNIYADSLETDGRLNVDNGAIIYEFLEVYCNTTNCRSVKGYTNATNGAAILGRSYHANGYSGLFGGGLGVEITPKLHINGDLNVTGNIYYDGSLTNYHMTEANIELVNGDVEEGDVLVISEDYDSSAEISSEEYDTKVFGVAVEDTEVGEEVGVVILGRFPVKVTAENGAIERGDMLTTSSLPGYAMKCDDKIKCIGAVIGKALEPLESGTGRINVMVSPQ